MSSTALPRSPSGLPTLALIMALLVLPIAIAGSLYASGWRPAQGSQHGTLIDPPRPLPLGELLDGDSRPLTAAGLDGKWLLILAGHGPCQAACAGRVDEMRRLQVSLNKDMLRLRRMVLTDAIDDAALRDFRQRQPDLVLAAAPAGWSPTPESREAADYRLYIADPQGRLIIAYAADVAGPAVRTDLERLLKFAWSG